MICHMSVKRPDGKPRPRRGARALSDAEEWAVYGRVRLGGERVEALALEYGVTTRTIENALKRRRSAIERESAQSDGSQEARQ